MDIWKVKLFLFIQLSCLCLCADYETNFLYYLFGTDASTERSNTKKESINARMEENSDPSGVITDMEMEDHLNLSDVIIDGVTPNEKKIGCAVDLKKLKSLLVEVRKLCTYVLMEISKKKHLLTLHSNIPNINTSEDDTINQSINSLLCS